MFGVHAVFVCVCVCVCGGCARVCVCMFHICVWGVCARRVVYVGRRGCAGCVVWCVRV